MYKCLDSLSKRLLLWCCCCYVLLDYYRQNVYPYECQCECKKQIRHGLCEEDYAWNPSICAYEYDKDCKIGGQLKNCTCKKNLVDDLGVTCDEVVNTPKIEPINSTNKTSDRFFLLIYQQSHIYYY